MIWTVRLVFCYSSPATSITKHIYKININIFLLCKCERHFTNTFVQQRTTTLVIYSNTDNKLVTVALACYITLVINSLEVLNHCIVCRTFYASNDMFEGHLKSSWTHLITLSQNFVEVW
jgi:hypothetical protein